LASAWREAFGGGDGAGVLRSASTSQYRRKLLAVT
jgi:hypothetical protein